MSFPKPPKEGIKEKNFWYWHLFADRALLRRTSFINRITIGLLSFYIVEKKRKIAMVGRKVSFAEAEEADDIYWANASYAERLNTIYDLRKMFGGDGKIKKVAKKRSIYEEED